MRKIILDGRYMKTKEKAHAYLKKKLNRKDYYGNNLDALWDILSTYSEQIEIKFINKDKLIEQLESYGNDIIEIFNEAEEENPNINIIR